LRLFHLYELPRKRSLGGVVHPKPRKEAARPTCILPVVLTESTEKIRLLHSAPEREEPEDQTTGDQEEGIGADEADLEMECFEVGISQATLGKRLEAPQVA
jgi:hypothetical protein